MFSSDSGGTRDRFPRRRGVRLDQDIARVHYPGEWSGLPLAEAVVDGADPGDWLVDHRELATDLLRRHGAFLLRGFDCDEPGLERAVGRFSGGLLDYSYRSTPRSTVVGRVYTSTEYPSDQVIPLHNEMSYAARWPGLLWFLCVTPASAGGATPVASSRAVWERIPVALRERFESKGVQYRRVFGPNLDLPWQEAFQATDRAQVNAECRRQGLRYEWLDASRLVTSVVRPASIEHRATGVRVWFNQAHLFHDSTLAAGVRSALLSAVGEEGMPRSARYGDGSPVHDDDIAAIADAYAAVAVDAAWQAGDLLVMDNEAMAHGRRPFSGQRRVVVAMSEQSGGPADGT